MFQFQSVISQSFDSEHVFPFIAYHNSQLITLHSDQLIQSYKVCFQVHIFLLFESRISHCFTVTMDKVSFWLL